MNKKFEPELWGGVECTVTRIGNKFVDQLELNGHATRLSDLELFAELGIKALRYPGSLGAHSSYRGQGGKMGMVRHQAGTLEGTEHPSNCRARSSRRRPALY
jgi:hypothetical protein